MKQKITASAILFMIVLFLIGCSTKNNQNSINDNIAQNYMTKEIHGSLEMFTSRDIEIGYNENECRNIILSNETVTISQEGIYILSGSIDDGRVIVDAGASDSVQLVLSGVIINSNSSAAIYVKEASKVFITLATDSENLLSVSDEYIPIDDNNIDAVIFSKCDLTLNGRGSLIIQGAYGNGITSKDNLILTSGTYTITSAEHGIEANDSVRILDGSINITSGKDGIQAENKEDSSLGFIYIADGDFVINAQSDGFDASGVLEIMDGVFEIASGDDGIHGNGRVVINDGMISIIESYEGIEGQSIDINGGSIKLIASDDGLNSAGGVDESGVDGRKGRDRFASDENCYISISNGTIIINALGDGIDSNGDLIITGGETYVSGPSNNGNGAMDYDGKATITGGVFVAAGASEMAQNFGEESTQGSILVNTQSFQVADSLISLKDSRGTALVTFSPENKYNSVVISCAEIQKGKEYVLTMGLETQNIRMTDLVYGKSQGGFGGGMRPGKEAGWNRPPNQ